MFLVFLTEFLYTLEIINDLEPQLVFHFFIRNGFDFTRTNFFHFRFNCQMNQAHFFFFKLLFVRNQSFLDGLGLIFCMLSCDQATQDGFVTCPESDIHLYHP